MSSAGETDAVCEQMGSFDLVECLGHGGMAEVWLARRRNDPDNRKLVALKRLLPHLRQNAGLIKSLLDEARIASNIVHPNIVRVYGSGHDGAVFYVTMEYLEGITLARLMGEATGRSCPIPLQVGAFIVSRVCHGLHHAHVQTDAHGRPLQIVHRDVSPQNVMLQFDGGVKLLDFGIARARDRLTEPTKIGGLKGKPAYLSPEVCRGAPADWRADIHACGILLWELIAGQRLFRERDPCDSVKRIMAGDVRSPSEHNVHTPRQLEEVALQALATEPTFRPQSAREMAQILDGYLAGEGVDGAAALATYLTRLLGSPEQRIAVGLESKLTAQQWLDRVPSTHRMVDAQVGGAEQAPTEPHEISEGPTDTESTVVALDQVWAGGVVRLESNSRRNRWGRSRLVIAVALVALACISAAVVLLRSNARYTEPVHDAGGVPTRAIVADSRLHRAPAAQHAQPGHVSRPQLPTDASASAEISTFEAETRAQDAAVGGSDGSRRSGAAPRVRPVAVRTTVAGSARRATATRADAGARYGQSPDASGQHLPVKRSREPGWLNLLTKPWTTIYRGKERIGNTPLVRVALPAGTLTLRATNPPLGIDRKISVTIMPGKVTRIALRFDK